MFCLIVCLFVDLYTCIRGVSGSRYCAADIYIVCLAYLFFFCSLTTFYALRVGVRLYIPTIYYCDYVRKGLFSDSVQETMRLVNCSDDEMIAQWNAQFQNRFSFASLIHCSICKLAGTLLPESTGDHNFALHTAHKPPSFRTKCASDTGQMPFLALIAQKATHVTGESMLTTQADGPASPVPLTKLGRAFSMWTVVPLPLHTMKQALSTTEGSRGI